MSTVKERRARIERDLVEAKAFEGPIDGRKLLEDLEWLLEMSKPPLAPAVAESVDLTDRPRVWGGTSDTCGRHWWWKPTAKAWCHRTHRILHNGDIFVPACHPRPTEAPTEKVLLPECDEIDW